MGCCVACGVLTLEITEINIDHIHSRGCSRGIKLWPCLEAFAVIDDSPFNNRVRKHERQDPALAGARNAWWQR
jgi:hypothetical protein